MPPVLPAPDQFTSSRRRRPEWRLVRQAGCGSQEVQPDRPPSEPDVRLSPHPVLQCRYKAVVSRKCHHYLALVTTSAPKRYCHDNSYCHAERCAERHA